MLRVLKAENIVLEASALVLSDTRIFEDISLLKRYLILEGHLQPEPSQMELQMNSLMLHVWSISS